MSFKASLNDTFFHTSTNSLGLYLSQKWLFNFLSNFYMPSCVGKLFKFIKFTVPENALIRGILLVPLLTQYSPSALRDHTLSRRKLLITPGNILSKICYPQQQKGVEKTDLLYQSSGRKYEYDLEH